MEKGDFNYIVDATNEMHHILLETIDPSEDDFRKIFAIACNTLKRVAAQTEVLEDLTNLAIRQEQFWTEYKEICGSVDHFVYGFCKIERRVLVAAGVKEETAESLIQEAIHLRESIKDLRINPHGVQENLKKLRDEACNIAKHIHNLPMERDEKRKTKKRLKKYFYGIGGTAIVVIDGGALALSLGMSFAGTAVSGSVGSGLVGASLAIE
jgi:hypothetical protein